MKNILITTENFLIGGLETRLIGQIEFLNRNGFNIYLAAVNVDKKMLDNLKIKGFILLNKMDYNLSFMDIYKNVELIKNFIISKEIDLVDAHPFLTLIPSLIAAKLCNIKFITNIHGPYFFKFDSYGIFYKYFCEEFLFNESDLILCVSEETAQLSSLYCEETKIKIIRNGVDINKFKESKFDFNKPWAIVSRIEDNKLNGIKILLKNAAELGATEIHIYGDGLNKDKLINFIKEIQNVKIVYMGSNTQIYSKLYNNYSLIAGMGRVILEAASLNIPAILIGYDGIKGIVDKNLLERSKWWNYSGRGNDNISIENLKKQFEYIKKNNNFNLRNWVIDNANENDLWQDYINIIDSHDCKNSIKIQQLYNFIKLNLVNNNYDELYMDLIYLTKFKDKYEKRYLFRNEFNNSYIKLIDKVTDYEKKISQLEESLNNIYNSNFWKVAKIYYNLRDKTFLKYLIKSIKIINNEGILAFIKKINKKISLFYYNSVFYYYIENKRFKKELIKILNSNKNKTIIIFLPFIDWNIPLFQRPQHIANKLSKYNYLYFYGTNNIYDNVKLFKRISNNLYLSNISNKFFQNEFFSIINKVNNKKIIHLYSTDLIRDYEQIIKFKDKGYEILYEYVDEISSDISGIEIPNKVIERHNKVLKNNEIMIVATAQKLYDEVIAIRGYNNCKLITNGVDFEHFSRKFDQHDIPDKMVPIIKKRKPIIGYFGALAKWFDYELIIKIANNRPNYEIVLIGSNYDNSINNYNINYYSNINYLNTIDYKVLPKYAFWFDVCIIPFILNEVTESTSPIKLFEYMALGKPIVTTNMRECKKYKSVLTSLNHEEFIKNIDKALELKNNQDYLFLLNKEALENTWDAKALEISNLITSKL